uniref:Ubiquitin-like protease family profile domain-containing protein n=1 Tax=Manihot esculenta TaxID=3983 RepID=A0A2C9V2D2_MANES
MVRSVANKKILSYSDVVLRHEDLDILSGGSHWSLVVYDRIANVFVHRDSCSGTNKRHALQLYKAVVRFVGASDGAADGKYMELVNSPQQVNCGLYVTAIARGICSWNKNCHQTDRGFLWFCVVNDQVTPSAVAAMGNEILCMIRRLMESK